MGDYYGDYGDYEDMDYDLAALQALYNYNAYQQMYNQQYANMMREYANLYDEANQYTQNYMNQYANADQMQEQSGNGGTHTKSYNPSQSVANAYNAYQNQYGYY